MRFTSVVLILVAAALGGLGSLVVPGALGSKNGRDARTALERSVLHDQASAGAVARPPFAVTRVRCRPAKGYCNVRRETNARRLSSVMLVRVPIALTTNGGWKYRAMDADAAKALDAARENVRVVWGISATWSE